ncbi:hypothetical protein KJ365_07010 [Glaciecola sp. XM2]|uniref:DUF350 domain-containing protein n=1 Tax=Glaciecola sp. XM2 TaxID=1914931 RepID=UPI001BDF4C37|nr:DUF350 domain-containing protein [Glaciecola sp. XM2]MBT1450629.1 hypothetical protein [Glaciecola sp. XM2]
MEQLVTLNSLSSDLPLYLAIDIGIAVVLLLAIRALAAVFSKISVRDELGERDNFAFGISIAGRMLSLTIVLSAVVGRHVGMGYDVAAMGMLMFGTLGIFLVKVGRWGHDKIVLNRFDKDKMISEKNVSVALVDAASAVSCAIITKSIIEWAQGSDMNAIVAIVSGTAVVLLVLLMVTRLYEYRYAEYNQDNSFQRTLCKGQLALAVQHSGNLIGTAIAVSAAGNILQYDATAYVSNITGWLIVGLSMALLLMLLSSLTKRVVLYGVNFRREVALQHNVGVASIEAVLAMGIALLFSNILVVG